MMSWCFGTMRKRIRSIFFLLGTWSCILLYIFLVEISQPKNAQKEEPELPKFEPLLSLYSPPSEGDHWHTVRSGEDDFYVFSAYYDEIADTVPVVNIIAVGKRDKTVANVTCKYYYANDAQTPSKSGKGEVIPIRNKRQVERYLAKWVKCSLPDAYVPSSVSLEFEGSLQHKVPIHYKEKYSTIPNTINVCVRSIFNAYDDALKVSEFIEFYKQLGVHHFTFYDLSIGPNVMRLLRKDEERGWTTILPYDLPNDVDVFANGQYATNQDCILRARGNYQYLIIVDLDEFIIPRKHSNFLSMIESLESPVAGHFSFACLFFCDNFNSNETIVKYYEQFKAQNNIGSETKFELVTQTKTLAASAPCYFPFKSKLIIKPWTVIQVRVHNVEIQAEGFENKLVEPAIAMNQHYRYCTRDMLRHRADLPCPAFQDGDTDLTAQKYIADMSARVLYALRNASIPGYG